MAKMIVVGVDGSNGSRRALEWSAGLARDVGAEIQVVHVESRAALWEFSAIQIDINPYLAELQGLLDGLWTQPLRDAEVKFHTQLVRGDPATELLRIAVELDAYLVVAGARKHAALHDLIVGGTAHKLVNRANRPVVLVPPLA
jgi:nucleotide-binding universal stress UspA family protein